MKKLLICLAVIISIAMTVGAYIFPPKSHSKMWLENGKIYNSTWSWGFSNTQFHKSKSWEKDGVIYTDNYN